MGRELKRAKRLDILIEIAQNAVNEALSYMGGLQNNIRQEEQKAETLSQYQQEYQANFQQQAQGGMSGQNLQQYESFLLQINQAMKTQATQLETLQQQLKQAQDIYAQLKQRLASYEKLQGRLMGQVRQMEEKQLQTMADEISAQLHRLHQL